MSLKQTITEYLKSEYPRIVHKGEIGRKAILEWGYENENAGRRCRELENEGVIECIKNHKHEAQYRYKGGYSDRGSGRTVNPLFKSSIGATPIPPTKQNSALQPPQRVVNWLKQFKRPVEKEKLTLF